MAVSQEPGHHDPTHAHRPLEHDPQLHRLLLLTDGVYAIALTLLALDLRLPPEAVQARGEELLASLLSQGPHLLAYVTSFTVIALYWSLNHRLMRLVYRCDASLVWLTLLHLLCIAFLPFPTVVIGEHLGDPVAEEFYFGSLVVTTLISAAIWWYASWDHRLVAADLDDNLIQSYRILSLAGLAGTVLLIGLVMVGLVRVIEPLLVGYILTLAFIVEGIVYPIERLRQHRSARPADPAASGE